MSGWQPHIGKDEEFIPYKLRDMELSMKDGCVLWAGGTVSLSLLQGGR